MLTWEQINFLKGILTVGRSKTVAGSGRTIPINSELRGILEAYRVWYEANIGSPSPERYMFPHGKSRKWDPSRPISSLQTAWENVRSKAGVKARFHDLRHHADSVIMPTQDRIRFAGPGLRSVWSPSLNV